MSPHEFLLFMVGMGLVVLGCGFAAGRWVWPSYRRAIRLSERALDDAYDEGYDDGLHDQRTATLDLPSPVTHTGPALIDHGVRPEQARAAGRAGELDVPMPVLRNYAPAWVANGHDWRADMAEQLAPAVLDAENLPGPVRMPAHGAGEHYLEAPLPALLHLGAEFDGGDQTFARVALRQMTAINAHERARKALCEECGITWIPMEAVAA